MEFKQTRHLKCMFVCWKKGEKAVQILLHDDSVYVWRFIQNETFIDFFIISKWTKYTQCVF